MSEFHIDFSPEGDASIIITAPKPRRFFTVDQANRALVLIRRIVADILLEYEKLNDLQETIEAAQAVGRSEHAKSITEELVDAISIIHGYVEELDELGVELKDWTLGVVDFPCVANGREVVLCWQPDEQEVGFWHEVNAEPGVRRPLETLVMSPPLVTVKRQ